MAAQWPPKSPHDVLMMSPGGREKLRRLAEQQSSPTASPTRLRSTRSIPAISTRNEDDLFDGMDVDDDEDEETLQLKLQAIQAKLRLKKLQAAKALKRATAESRPTGPSADSADSGGKGEVPFQAKLATVAAVRDRIERDASRDLVQVPASPVRTGRSNSDVQTSPQRVLLGIDKGLKGADVSLKRAPSRTTMNLSRQSDRPGGYLRRTNSTLSSSQEIARPASTRPLSFNERLAQARSEETARQERRERAQKARSTGFTVTRQEMEEYKAKAQDLPELPSKPQEYTREQVLASMGKPLGHTRSNTEPGLRSTQPTSATSSFTSFTGSPGGSEPAIEPYSGLQLSKRILPHNVLARAVSGKKIYLLKDLLRQIKAPDWCFPDDEVDVVVFAIVATKSEPRNHRPGPGGDGRQQDRGKYMVITLVDLEFEVELFLFNSGFDRFWKLTAGTVVAILNPSILPPPQGREATNRFGLVINSDADTILEIGNARDIGYCKSIKKDGSYCNAWVNAKRTEFCEFHTNQAVRKARSSRLELSSTAGFGSDGGPRSRVATAGRRLQQASGATAGPQYDRFTQSQYFVSSGLRGTDPDDERLTGIADRKEREEALKRRLAQREKERDMARRLAEAGTGAGREYMTRAATRTSATAAGSGSALGSSFSSAVTTTSSFSSAIPSSSAATSASFSFGHDTQQQQSQQPPPRRDARALGLVGRRGADQPKISLASASAPASSTANGATGAIKRKRPESSGSSTTTATTTTTNNNQRAPLGWGAGLASKLARMREGEKLDGTRPRAGSDGTTTSDASAGGERPRRGLFGGREVPVLNPATSSLSDSAAVSALSRRGSEDGGRSPQRRDDKSPVRKKTRFLTDKGIREAGRESLGEPLSAAGKMRRQVVLDLDDDDDLIVVR